MSDRVTVYRIELLVVDHDEIGLEGITEALELTSYPNDCINPSVMGSESREVEWSDDHPLNQIDTTESEYTQLFNLERL